MSDEFPTDLSRPLSNTFRKSQIFRHASEIQVYVAQNVGKVWISQKKTLPAPFGAIPGNFLRRPEKSENAEILPIFLGGPLLLSTLGGAIGILILFVF